MLTIHHLHFAQSERVVWLCEELGLEYDLKIYDRDPETRLAPAELKALHPMEVAPLLQDGELMLGESGAIIDYIIGKYAPDTNLVLGPDHPDFANHLYWSHFATATFMANYMMQIAVMLAGAKMPPNMAKRVKNTWAHVEDFLGTKDYFGGDQFTTADIMMGFQLTTARAVSGFKIDAMPNLKAYLQRIGTREAFQRAMAKAEPGMPPKLD